MWTDAHGSGKNLLGSSFLHALQRYSLQRFASKDCRISHVHFYSAHFFMKSNEKMDIDPFQKVLGKWVVTPSFPYHCYDIFSCSLCCAPAKCAPSKYDFLVDATCCTRDCKARPWAVCAACACTGKRQISRLHISNRARHLSSKQHLDAMASCSTGTFRVSAVSQTSIPPDLQIEFPVLKRNTDRSRELDDLLNSLLGPDMQGFPYLRYEIKHGLPGRTRLVVDSVFPSCFGIEDFVDPDEAQKEFEACYNFWSLPKSARERICNQMHWWYMQGKKHQQQDNDPEFDPDRTKRITPPRDMAELDRRYFRGRSSITSSLPIPPTDESIKGHTMTSPRECIRNLLASNTNFEEIRLYVSSLSSLGVPYTWITETPRADEIKQLVRYTISNLAEPIKHRILCLPLLVWQDDFDPNSSTKNNRTNCWCKTLTIAPPRHDRNNVHQTYPVAIGKSKANSHDRVELSLAKEFHSLQEAPSIMFSRCHGGPVAVFASVYAVLTDQIERRKATMTTPGNAVWHARFRYSTLAASLVPVLRTCQSCTDQLRNGNIPRGCPNCVCWDVDVGLGAGAPAAVLEKLKLEIPKNYPRTHLQNTKGIEYITTDNRILPFRLTTERLKTSYDLAYQNLVSKNWTNEEATEFLKRECVDKAIGEKLCSVAANVRVLSEVRSGASNEGQEARKLIEEDARKKPAEYRKPKSPSCWDIPGGLSVFVDVLMHLLFLGIIKSTLKSLRIWMKRQGKHTEFHSQLAELNRLLKSLESLEWLRCKEYRSSGKFGGWVSENYMAFARVMQWFFQNVPDLSSSSAKGAEPAPEGLCLSSWKKGHLVYWLRARGQKTCGTVPVLRARIRKLRAANPSLPEQTTVAGEYIPEQVERMLVALEKMLQSVMVEEVVPGKTIPEMELHIKLFLTEFDLLDQQVKIVGAKPKIISSYNFMCLLNLPELTKRFGPLRNLWEGGHKGEGFIRSLKKYLRFGQRTGFETNALTNCYIELGLRRAAEGMYPGKASRVVPGISWLSALQALSNQYKTYPNLAAVVSLIKKGEALSVLICSFGYTTLALAVVHDKMDGLYFVSLAPSGEQIKKMGIQYEEWKADKKMSTTRLAGFVQPHAAHLSFGVLLPLTPQSGTKHTLVRSARYGV